MSSGRSHGWHSPSQLHHQHNIYSCQSLYFWSVESPQYIFHFSCSGVPVENPNIASIVNNPRQRQRYSTTKGNGNYFTGFYKENYFTLTLHFKFESYAVLKLADSRIKADWGPTLNFSSRQLEPIVFTWVPGSSFINGTWAEIRLKCNNANIRTTILTPLIVAFQLWFEQRQDMSWSGFMFSPSQQTMSWWLVTTEQNQISWAVMWPASASVSHTSR